MVSVEKLVNPASPSQQWLADAEEIEKLISQLKRPTAKVQVMSLVEKIREEASTFESVESMAVGVKPEVEADPSPSPPSNPVPTVTAKPIATGIAVSTPSVTYQTIDRFAIDLGTNKDKFVTLYLPLPGVGSIPDKKEQITCDFGTESFDVIVRDLNGKSYRLKKDKLEHDIDPEKSKYIVKADKIVVKLMKLKGGLGGEYNIWTKLTDPKWKDKKKKDVDPRAGMMEMIEDMYKNGDDKMRKIIGESLIKNANKANQGTLQPPGMQPVEGQ